MKIPRRLIIHIALQLFQEKGKKGEERITQIEIHKAIAHYLNRQLTIGDKNRITRILESQFYLEKVERDNRIGMRIYIFKR